MREPVTQMGALERLNDTTVSIGSTMRMEGLNDDQWITGEGVTVSP